MYSLFTRGRRHPHLLLLHRYCPVLHRIQQWIQSEGRAQWTFRSLRIGESIGCSSGLWATLRVEILWCLWLKRLNAMYGNLFQDFSNLKETLIKVGEEYFIRTLARLEKNIDSLAHKSRSFQESSELESLGRKKQLLISADLSLILKLQYP